LVETNRKGFGVP